MLFLIYGEDELSGRDKKNQLVQQFKEQRDKSGLNVLTIKVEKNKTDPELVLDFFQTPFLAEKKLIIIEGALKEGGEFTETILKKLERQSLPETTNLIFFEKAEKFAGVGGKIFNLLKNEKYVFYFPAQNDRGKINRLIDFAASAGFSLEQGAAELIVRHSPDPLFAHQILLQAIGLESQGKKITKNSILLIIDDCSKEEANAFKLIDMIFTQNADSLVLEIQKFLINNEAGLFFGLLTRQIKILSDLHFGEKPQNQNGAPLPPFAEKSALANLKKIKNPRAWLSNASQELLKLDRAQKIGDKLFEAKLLLCAHKLSKTVKQ